MMRAVIVGVCAIALGAGMGCSGGDDGAGETTPGASVTASSGTAVPVDGSPTAALASPGPDDWPEMNPDIRDTIPLEEALSFGEVAWKVPLTPVATDGSFTLSLPSTWAISTAEGQTFFASSYRDDQDRLFAGLTMECLQGVALEQLVVDDRNFIFGTNQGYQVFAPRPAEIGGRRFEEVRWSGGLTGLISDNITFYLQEADCVRRFQFGTYHGLRIKDFRGEIEAILASFETGV